MFRLRRHAFLFQTTIHRLSILRSLAAVPPQVTSNILCAPLSAGITDPKLLFDLLTFRTYGHLRAELDPLRLWRPHSPCVFIIYTIYMNMGISCLGSFEGDNQMRPTWILPSRACRLRAQRKIQRDASFSSCWSASTQDPYRQSSCIVR